MLHLYKHVNNTDVAFEILKLFYVKEKQLYKLKVRWWNVGKCHTPWCMMIDQQIQIPKDRFINEWKRYGKDPQE